MTSPDQIPIQDEGPFPSMAPAAERKGRVAIIRYKLLRLHSANLARWFNVEKLTRSEVIRRIGVARQTFYSMLQFIDSHPAVVWRAVRTGEQEDWAMVEDLLFAQFGNFRQQPFYSRMIEDVLAGRVVNQKRPGPKPGRKARKPQNAAVAGQGRVGSVVKAPKTPEIAPSEHDVPASLPPPSQSMDTPIRPDDRIQPAGATSGPLIDAVPEVPKIQVPPVNPFSKAALHGQMMAFATVSKITHL